MNRKAKLVIFLTLSILGCHTLIALGLQYRLRGTLTQIEARQRLSEYQDP